jgi:hypothetical protein
VLSRKRIERRGGKLQLHAVSGLALEIYDQAITQKIPGIDPADPPTFVLAK